MKLESQPKSPLSKVLWLLRWLVMISGVSALLGVALGLGDRVNVSLAILFWLPITAATMILEIASKQGYPAHLKKRAGVLYWLSAVGFILCIFINASSGSNENLPPSTEKQVQTSTAGELDALVNQVRKQAGSNPITLEQRLSKTAQRKADEMNTQGYYDHVNPNDDSRGTDMIFAELGYECVAASENIVKNTYTSKSAIDAWSGSPSHYAAMVDPKYDIVGYGISADKIVQHFCDLK